MKLAFFDTKSYDIPGFDRYGIPAGVEIKYFEPNLNRDTVTLAAGFDAVCVFVNDTVDAVVVDKLHQLGVKAIVLRCAGFNNVDIKACEGKLRVFLEHCRHRIVGFFQNPGICENIPDP